MRECAACRAAGGGSFSAVLKGGSNWARVNLPSGDDGVCLFVYVYVINQEIFPWCRRRRLLRASIVLNGDVPMSSSSGSCLFFCICC